LQRLTRAIYDKTTFIYTHDKTGNRLPKRVILTKPMGTVDFDGDGKTDIAAYHSGAGSWYVIPSSVGSPYGVVWGGDPTDIPVTTNFSSIY
jgi:hypothetical protein